MDDWKDWKTWKVHESQMEHGLDEPTKKAMRLVQKISMAWKTNLVLDLVPAIWLDLHSGLQNAMVWNLETELRSAFGCEWAFGWGSMIAKVPELPASG